MTPGFVCSVSHNTKGREGWPGGHTCWVLIAGEWPDEGLACGGDAVAQSSPRERQKSTYSPMTRGGRASGRGRWLAAARGRRRGLMRPRAPGGRRIVRERGEWRGLRGRGLIFPFVLERGTGKTDQLIGAGIFARRSEGAPGSCHGEARGPGAPRAWERQVAQGGKAKP